MKRLFLIAGVVALMAPVLVLADGSTEPLEPSAQRTHGWVCYNQTEWPPMHVCIP